MKITGDFRKFLNNESGATAVEYGLLAAGMALLVGASLTTLKTTLSSLFTKIGTNITTVDSALS